MVAALCAAAIAAALLYTRGTRGAPPGAFALS
jgi:hypothetical protein